MPDKNIGMYRYMVSAVLFLLCIHSQSKDLIFQKEIDDDKYSCHLSFTLSSCDKFNNHPDSMHLLNFRYPDEKRGFRPYIAPALLISGGTVMHFMTTTKENFNEFVSDNYKYDGRIDDYAQYAPLAAVYALKALGVGGENNFGNMTAIAVKSFLLNGLITDRIKYMTNVERPNGELRSFPSGHTSKVFCLAHLMHREYGSLSAWYSIGAYSCAVTTGVLRIAKGAHWVSDVIAGAGIGILSTELVYLTHQYKWDNEHLKRLDILPFQSGRQRGVTLVYNF